MLEILKAVVWARGFFKSKKPAKGEPKGYYRYTIIGLLVTEQPIEAFEGKETILLGGETRLSLQLGAVAQRDPAINIRGYSANQILTSLQEM